MPGCSELTKDHAEWSISEHQDGNVTCGRVAYHKII